jgi:putative colanic acid biosynthesis UDP-glucose lipid carrier transferase
MVDTKGIIQNNINTFALFYRMADIIVISLSLALALFLYSATYNQEYFIMCLVGIIAYSFSAEALALYRSWRSGYFN